MNRKNPDLKDPAPVSNHACFSCCHHILPELTFDLNPDWMPVMMTLPDRSPEKIFGAVPLLPPPQA
jgi:hypothetical protein